MKSSFRAAAALVGANFAFANGAVAGFDLKYTCVLNHIPAGASLAAKEAVIEIDDLFLRARIQDEMTAHAGHPVFSVDGIDVRKARILVSYQLTIPPEVMNTDMVSGPNKTNIVEYRHSIERKTGKYRLNYSYGHINRRDVTLKGRCNK